MYAPELKDKIKYFIRCIGKVEHAQIHYMFREYDPLLIDGCIKRLIFDGCITQKDTMYTRAEGIYGSAFTQKLITRAAWVLCYFGSDKIIDYYTSQFPFQLFFITEGYRCFDVTAMNAETAFSANSAAKRVFDMTTPQTPDGELRDSIKHIAVVLGSGNPRELIAPDFFDYYAEITENQVAIRELSTGRALKR